MKHIFIAITTVAAWLLAADADAQFTVGAQGMTISPNTTVYIDSLKLDNNNAAMVISNNSLQVTYQSISGTGGNSIARVYQFTNPIVFNGTLGFYYHDAELGSNIEANLQVAYQSQSGGSWTTTSNSIVSAPLNHVYSPGFNNSLFRVTAVSSGTVLAVQLLSFEARRVGDKVLLKWVTASENKNDRFIIERSGNGKDFETLGVQRSNAANGNSNENLSYAFEDTSPLMADNFYRLKLVNKNEDASYSPVRLVSFPSAGSGTGNKILVSIFPNPAQGMLYADLGAYAGNAVSVKVHDMRGSLVFKKQIDVQTNKTISLPVDNLEPGLFYLNILDDKGNQLGLGKFMKQ